MPLPFLDKQSLSSGFTIDVDSLPEWRKDLLSIVIYDHTHLKISKSDHLSSCFGISDEDYYFLGRMIVIKLAALGVTQLTCSNFEEIVRLGVFPGTQKGELELDGFCETDCIPEEYALDIMKECINFIKNGHDGCLSSSITL